MTTASVGHLFLKYTILMCFYVICLMDLLQQVVYY